MNDLVYEIYRVLDTTGKPCDEPWANPFITLNEAYQTLEIYNTKCAIGLEVFEVRVRK